MRLRLGRVLNRKKPRQLERRVYWRRKQPPFEKWRLLSNFNRCMLKGTAVGAADPSFTEEGR